MKLGQNWNELENFIILVASGVLFVLGPIILLSFSGQLYSSLCSVFFALGAAFLLFLLFIDFTKTETRTAPKTLLINPHFTNAVTFLTFALCKQGSVLYIFDTSFMFLALFGKFFAMDGGIRKMIASFCEADLLMSALTYSEIFAVAELFIAIFVKRSLGSIFCFIIYIIFVSMYGYKVSAQHKKIWQICYQFILSLSKDKNMEKAKIAFNGILGFCDTLSKIAGFVFPTTPFKAQFQ